MTVQKGNDMTMHRHSVVLARQKGGQLSYPYCMERRPGELWVIAGFAFKKGWQEPSPLRLKIDEEAFLSEARKG